MLAAAFIAACSRPSALGRSPLLRHHWSAPTCAQAIGVASTTVAAGSATPAQAAATLEKTMQSQSS